jgi:hypothetical protein
MRVKESMDELMDEWWMNEGEGVYG